MRTVLIVYASDYGNTKAMAEAVAEGVESVPGTRAVIRTAEAATAEDLINADALVFGSPVHMGSIDWRMKKFIDSVTKDLWVQDALCGKVGAVFASGAGYGNAGGGAELTMLAMLADMAELGLLLVPLPKQTPGYAVAGLHWGPYGRSAGEKMEPVGVSAEQCLAARHHGANIARVAEALTGRTVFAK